MVIISIFLYIIIDEIVVRWGDLFISVISQFQTNYSNEVNISVSSSLHLVFDLQSATFLKSAK